MYGAPRVRSFARYVCLATAILAVAAAAASASRAAGVGDRTYTTPPTLPLRTGLVDSFVFNRPNPQAFALTRKTGAEYVRLSVDWSSIAPVDPPDGFDPSDPTSPGYSWSALDAIVGTAEAAGLTPILDISGTPSWGFNNPPDGVNAGSPKPVALGQFARALATHYVGENGLPAVHVFEVWNEPNLSLDLSPATAAVYRPMVNAVAASVHAVDSSNLVVAGGLDPFSHEQTAKQKWYSIAPLAFMRSLLCVAKGAHPSPVCLQKVHFDVWSHHPYSYGGPFGSRAVVRRRGARRSSEDAGSAAGRRAVEPRRFRDPRAVLGDGVQLGQQPTEEIRCPDGASCALDRGVALPVWRSGVSLLTWFGLEDRRSPSPYQSGLYFHARSLELARPKPVLTAFRFPFVALPASHDSERLGPRRDERPTTRQGPAPARESAAVGGRSAPSSPTANGVFRSEAEAEGDEEGLAAGARARVGDVPRLLSHRAAPPRTSGPGAATKPSSALALPP